MSPLSNFALIGGTARYRISLPTLRNASTTQLDTLPYNLSDFRNRPNYCPRTCSWSPTGLWPWKLSLVFLGSAKCYSNQLSNPIILVSTQTVRSQHENCGNAAHLCLLTIRLHFSAAFSAMRAQHLASDLAQLIDTARTFDTVPDH